MGIFSRSKVTKDVKGGAPFPTRAIFILALCRICEPIAFMSIFPYIYYMVQSFGIAEDERTISIYAGMVTSAFAIAEFSASIFWGWLSDRIGRKPVLLTGLAGTGISMLVFGFAKSLPVALLARTLGGLLNGNIGVILTTVGEVVTEDCHQSRAFATMPFVWSIGSIIGAALGGSLADPVKNYPGLFRGNELFTKYPYLLPNLVCTTIVVCGVTIGFLFLEETHQDKRNQRDPGLALGRRFLRRLPGSGNNASASEEDNLFSAADEKGHYHPIPSSPAVSPTKVEAILPLAPVEVQQAPVEPKISIYHSLTKQIKLIIVSYALLALHTISLEQLLPILFASGHEGAATGRNFLQFDGGFELSAKTIGLILSMQGLLQMVSQIVIFPIVVERLGSLMTLRIAVLSYPALYFIIPYLATVSPSLRYPCIALVLVWKVTAQSFAFPSQSIMLANAAPAKKTLGTINGITMSAASLARAIGPTMIGIVHAAGRQSGYSILSWWTCACISVLGASISLVMAEPERATISVPQESRDLEQQEVQPLLVRISEDNDSQAQDTGLSRTDKAL